MGPSARVRLGSSVLPAGQVYSRGTGSLCRFRRGGLEVPHDNALVNAIYAVLRERLMVIVSSADIDLFETGLVDSIGLVELILALEDRFGISLPMENLEIDDLRSVDRIAGLIWPHFRRVIGGWRRLMRFPICREGRTMSMRRKPISVWVAFGLLSAGLWRSAGTHEPLAAATAAAGGGRARGRQHRRPARPDDDATASLLDNLSGTIFVLGDIAFPDGSAEAYADCYEPTWGRHKARTYAALGNHEYDSGSAMASFDYFGDRVGPSDLGYYSFDLGNWHIIVLNVNDFTVDAGPFRRPRRIAGSRPIWQPTRSCTLAMWHSPRFFSSEHDRLDQQRVRQPSGEHLYAAGVDVVLNAHQHHYERFPSSILQAPETTRRVFASSMPVPAARARQCRWQLRSTARR